MVHFPFPPGTIVFHFAQILFRARVLVGVPLFKFCPLTVTVKAPVFSPQSSVGTIWLDLLPATAERCGDELTFNSS